MHIHDGTMSPLHYNFYKMCFMWGYSLQQHFHVFIIHFFAKYFYTVILFLWSVPGWWLAHSFYIFFILNYILDICVMFCQKTTLLLRWTNPSPDNLITMMKENGNGCEHFIVRVAISILSSTYKRASSHNYFIRFKK